MIFGLLALSLAMALNLRASEPDFKIQNTWKLGLHGCRSASHFLHIARLNRIMLVDVHSCKLVNVIS